MMPSIVFATTEHLRMLWLVGALLLGVAAGCSEDAVSPMDSPGKGVYVSSAWQSARPVAGHHLHVVEQAIPCTRCHTLDERSIGPVTPDRCAACHAKEAGIEHARAQAQERFGTSAKTDCTVCHAFRADEATLAALDAGAGADGGAVHPFDAQDCKRCHLEQQGDVPGVQVHATSECVACHQPHEPGGPKPESCAECHQDVSRTHGASDTPDAEACRACHQHLHAPASHARSTCVDCHSKGQPRVPETALFKEGHTECIGCHRPHDFEKEDHVPCRTCHEDVIVLGGRSGHRECTTCHAPHDVSGSPDRACAGCHADKHPDHPKVGKAGTCVGCHDAHPPRPRAHSRARSCTSCHQAAASDDGFHGGTACRKCHTPHDFVTAISERRGCKSCHATQLAATSRAAGHAACEGCHRGLPHHPAARSVECAGCHGAARAEVNAGHTECRRCHEPHGGSVIADCAGCHRDEHRTAPAGHATCTSCHTAHGGKVSKTCRSCHAGQASTPHGRLGDACGSCHRPHGPKGTAGPPGCGTCHQRSTLPKLHAVTAHDACARCHTGHGQGKSGSKKDGCLVCHRDRTDHYPEASQCTRCHLFGK